MRNLLEKGFFAICNGVMALDIWIPFPVISNFYFGEPDFPYED